MFETDDEDEIPLDFDGRDEMQMRQEADAAVSELKTALTALFSRNETTIEVSRPLPRCYILFVAWCAADPLSAH